MRTGWRLGVILVLFAASALVLHRVPAVKGATNPVSLFALPMTLGAWAGAEGVPEEILPVDPNEKLSVRRTYRTGGQLAWADPATGLSLGYATDGYDRHEVRQPRRGTAISSIAASCAV